MRMKLGASGLNERARGRIVGLPPLRPPILLLLFGVQFSNSLIGFALFGNDLHSDRRLPEQAPRVLKLRPNLLRA